MKRALRSTSLGFLLSVAGAFSAQQTWTGQITDSMCGKDHSMMQHGGKKVSARECTLACVKDGSKYAFVSNGTVYEIQNQDLKDLATHAGHTVKLTGEMSTDGKALKVDKIEMPLGKKK
jgi:hypothetical protein